MSILHTIREIITGEKSALLNANAPIAARLADTLPVLYTYHPAQRVIDRKMIDGTVSRFYLSKNVWTYSAYHAQGKVEKYDGDIQSWRVWCSGKMADIYLGLRMLPTHMEYVDMISAAKELDQ